MPRSPSNLTMPGEVDDARFHVTQFRGFEKFCEGRPFNEMPSLIGADLRHLPGQPPDRLGQGLRRILARGIPPTAAQAAPHANLAQIVQSHALSFFHLSSPDLLLGMDCDPAKRNIFGVAAKTPELARDGIALRQFGQQIIERLGGKRIHPAWVVPGGVSAPLEPEQRDAILAGIPDALDRADRTLDWFKKHVARSGRDHHLRQLPDPLHGRWCSEGGNADLLRRRLTIVDASGNVVADEVDPGPIGTTSAKPVEPWSVPEIDLLQAARLSRRHLPCRPAGPAQRRRASRHPRADAELAEFRERMRRYPSSSFHYHYARLIEIVHCIDVIDESSPEPDILDPHVRARAQLNRNEGVGVSEAPAERSSTTTRSMRTAWWSGSTWSSPPATTTWR